MNAIALLGRTTFHKRCSLTRIFPVLASRTPSHSRRPEHACLRLFAQRLKRKTTTWPVCLIGALPWLALGTRTDIAFATSPITRVSHNSGCAHWEAIKRVQHYLKGTRGYWLKLGSGLLRIGGYTAWTGGAVRDGAYIILCC